MGLNSCQEKLKRTAESTDTHPLESTESSDHFVAAHGKPSIESRHLEECMEGEELLARLRPVQEELMQRNAFWKNEEERTNRISKVFSASVIRKFGEKKSFGTKKLNLITEINEKRFIINEETQATGDFRSGELE
ncbi:hypothetical protein GCK72_013409 [Caenorhabditis remanei]|uniref:Uncharacterized protein n=1 Tax=Caenorhabditis remanei TaxID=31234 RepID=A0A6A5GQP7_CAERE|nr:hypothetical protein GCK72_013409 [Caenorhabditis remanei]KAF1756954.1 hypothetical protein GCK72_013409 [Caenorhabditis remanei]